LQIRQRSFQGTDHRSGTANEYQIGDSGNLLAHLTPSPKTENHPKRHVMFDASQGKERRGLKGTVVNRAHSPPMLLRSDFPVFRNSLPLTDAGKSGGHSSGSPLAIQTGRNQRLTGIRA
jgi:hypothetical protein